MSTQEKILFFVSVMLFIIMIGGTVANDRQDAKRIARLEASVAVMKEDLGITVSKNWARDAWMREHNSELMKRIEKRVEK